MNEERLARLEQNIQRLRTVEANVELILHELRRMNVALGLRDTQAPPRDSDR